MASVWRRFELRALFRSACREEEQRTAAMDAIGGLGVKLSGVVLVVLRLRDLQLLLVQVVHFVFN